MKNYKFTLKQVVYIINDPHLNYDYQKCIVRKRTIIDGINYYQLSKLKYSIVNSSGPVFEKEIFDIVKKEIGVK